MTPKAKARIFAVLMLFLAAMGDTCAGSVQFGLPGYLPDPDPLQPLTPAQVFSTLRDDATARIRTPNQPYVAYVQLVDDPAQTTYVFFGKGHWAYPTVLRFRRLGHAGVWATYTAYSCGASMRACRRVLKKLRARNTQVAMSDEERSARDDVRRLQEPLPRPVRFQATDFWLSQFTLVPGLHEFDWRDPHVAHDTAPDPACKVVAPAFALPPGYPIREVVEGVTGTAYVVAAIDRDGRVVNGWIETSTRNRNLDQAALNAVSVMRFSVDGCSEPDAITKVRMPFEFTLGFSAGRGSGAFADFEAAAFGY